jgi:hypothetical protein
MPTYRFACACGYRTEKVYKALPSEAKQKSCACDECGKAMERALGDEGFYANGGQKGTVEAELGSEIMRDASGRPYFTDANGRRQEVRSVRDVDNWVVDGVPRMTKWRNPVTGRTEIVPMRTHMVANPETGEVDDCLSGSVVRQKERVVPLGRAGSYAPPSETSSGIPLKNGVMPKRDLAKESSGMVDPVTMKPMTRADFWGGPEGGVKTHEVQVKHPPPGKKW